MTTYKILFLLLVVSLLLHSTEKKNLVVLIKAEKLFPEGRSLNFGKIKFNERNYLIKAKAI